MKTTKIYLVENCYGDMNKVYMGKTKDNRESGHKLTFGSQIIYTYIDEIDSTDRKDWKPLESYWIEQFRQWGFDVMNKNNGGNGPEFHTEETKRKMSESLKGIKFSEEHKKNISKALKGIKRSEETKQKIKDSHSTPEYKIKINKAKKGKHQSEETKLKISQKRKGIKHTEETKLKMSESHSTLECKQNISKKLKGKIVSEETRYKVSEARSKPVLQYDLDGNFIREWRTPYEAAKTLGFKYPETIRNCCNEKIKTSHGFIWKFKKQ
jgi:hypothetical protein